MQLDTLTKQVKVYYYMTTVRRTGASSDVYLMYLLSIKITRVLILSE